ncbi:hypothetical protein NMY22_g3198 [Coprinellus aureogranulatus]|nr:hypothetical protein NMY22_g3198 [Coprinellus aureogranulatus]
MSDRALSQRCGGVLSMPTHSHPTNFPKPSVVVMPHQLATLMVGTTPHQPFTTRSLTAQEKREDEGTTQPQGEGLVADGGHPPTHFNLAKFLQAQAQPWATSRAVEITKLQLRGVSLVFGGEGRGCDTVNHAMEWQGKEDGLAASAIPARLSRSFRAEDKGGASDFTTSISRLLRRIPPSSIILPPVLPIHQKRNMTMMEDNESKKKKKGHRRSRERILGRLETRRENFLFNKLTSDVRFLDTYPSQFVGIKTSGKAVQKATKVHFPRGAALPSSLERVSEEGIHCVKFNKQALQGEPPNHPNAALVRLADVISPALQKRVLNLWDRIVAAGLKFPKHKNADNRSSTPAVHFGIWHHSSPVPMVTSDTRNQNPVVLSLLKELMTIIKTDIAPIIKSAIETYSPAVWPTQEKAHAYVKANIREGDQGLADCVDFGGSFFTVAMKEGSSERLHIDFNDHPSSLTWLVPFGDWTGGDFVAPQLGQVVPVRPGQILGAMTKTLLHCGTPITSGRRAKLSQLGCLRGEPVSRPSVHRPCPASTHAATRPTGENPLGPTLAVSETRRPSYSGGTRSAMVSPPKAYLSPYILPAPLQPFNMVPGMQSQRPVDKNKLEHPTRRKRPAHLSPRPRTTTASSGGSMCHHGSGPPVGVQMGEKCEGKGYAVDGLTQSVKVQIEIKGLSFVLKNLHPYPAFTQPHTLLSHPLNVARPPKQRDTLFGWLNINLRSEPTLSRRKRQLTCIEDWTAHTRLIHPYPEREDPRTGVRSAAACRKR